MGWDLERMAAALAELLGRAGPAAPLLLFVASLVEYVFPPFPGDLLVVLGAWYAVQGIVSWPLAYAAVTGGAVLGAALDYGFGRWLGPRLGATVSRRGRRAAERLARFERSYRRWGPALLLANRFFPGVRAFIFVGAGAARIPLARVLLLGGLSAALWNALLLLAGRWLVSSAAELVELLRRYNRLAWIPVVVLAAGWAAVQLWRRSRGASKEEG